MYRPAHEQPVPTPWRASEAALSGYGVFLSLIQALATWSGACTLMMTPFLAWGILLVSGIIGLCCVWVAWPQCPPALPAARPAYWAYLLPALTGLACLVLACSAWLKPDLTYDGNATHLPTIHFWAIEGRIHWIQPDPSAWDEHIRAGWNAAPKGWHAIAFTIARAAGTDRLLNATNLLFLPLGFLGIFALARRFGAGPTSSLTAASLFVWIPVNIAQTTTLYADSATASCFAGLAALAVAATMALMPWHLLPGLAALAGLAPALKFTGYVFTPCILILVAFAGLLMAMRTRNSRLARSTILFVALAGLGAMLLTGYWPVRNWMHTGTPFYPLGLSVAHTTVFQGATTAEALPQHFFHTPAEQASGQEWGQVQRVLWCWVQGLGRWPTSIRSYGSFDGGIGFLWILGCLPALALLAWTHRNAPSEARWAFWMILLLTVAVFMARPGNHIARHTYWIYLAGLPAWATLVTTIPSQRFVLLRRIGRGWVALCLAIALFEGTYALAYTVTRCGLRHQDWPPVVSDPTHAFASLTWYDPTGYLRPEMAGTLFEEIRTNRDPVAVAACNTEAQHLIGWLSHPLGERHIHFFDPDLATHPHTLDLWLKDHQIRYVVWDGKESLPETLTQRASGTSTAGIWFRIIEIRPD